MVRVMLIVRVMVTIRVMVRVKCYGLEVRVRG